MIARTIAAFLAFAGALGVMAARSETLTAASRAASAAAVQVAAVTRSTTPLPADSLVDQIGIVVHFGYKDTGYRFLTAANPAPNGSHVLHALQVLGVRHVRSGVSETESHGLGSATPATGGNGRCAAYQQASASGEDFELVTDIDDTKVGRINTTEADLRVAVSCFGSYASHILAIEGPNERGSGRNCSGVEPPPAPPMPPYVGTFRKTPTSECIPEIMGQQRIMWQARRDGVLPPSTQLWSGAFANTSCEEEYDIAHYTDAYGKHLYDYVDAVTAHAYLAFNEPEYTGGPGPHKNVPCSSTSHLDGGLSPQTYDFINDAAYGTLRFYYEAARYSGVPLDGSAPPKPVVMTETGYEATCCGNTDTDVDVPTVTKYTLRELLAVQAAGFAKEYIYELVSDKESLGLTDRELNPKPVYTALANFIRLLADPGYAALQTQPLAIGINAPGDVRYVVYQKHDGSNWLVIWQTDRGFEHKTMTPLGVAPATATVTLGAAPPVLRYYVIDPNSGFVAARSIAPSSSFALPVTDTPAVLEIGQSMVPALLGAAAHQAAGTRLARR
jgi:hypothetical protein